jgi:hypothetical protein
MTSSEIDSLVAAFCARQVYIVRGCSYDTISIMVQDQLMFPSRRSQQNFSKDPKTQSFDLGIRSNLGFRVILLARRTP